MRIRFFLLALLAATLLPVAQVLPDDISPEEVRKAIAGGVQFLRSQQQRDGSFVGGDSISDLVKAKAPEVDEEMRAKLDATMEAMNALYLRARTKESYDQMIGEGNAEGNKVVQNVVDALLDQTKAIEKAVTTLDLKSIDFAGSDSLDTPDKVVAGE